MVVEIDIPSIVTSVCPIEDIAEVMVKKSSDSISKLVEEIENKQIPEIERQEEEADREPNEEIKKKAKDRLKVQKDTLEQQKEDLQKQMDKMIEDMKEKIQEWLDAANIYAQEIADAASAIPNASDRYIKAGIALVKAETVTLVQISSEIATAAASVPPVVLSSLVTSAIDDITSAKAEYEAAKDNLKTAVTRFNTAVFNVEDILAPIAAIPILGPTIMAAVMVPINTAKGLVDVAAEVII